MYQKLADDLYLVHNEKEFDDLIDARWEPVKTVKPEGYIPDDVELMYPHRTQLFADYPILVMFEPGNTFNWTIVPVGKVIGGLGEIRQLDMHNVFKNYTEACTSCVPFMKPRVLLNAITIKPRTVPVGCIGHIHSTHNPDLMNAIANMGQHGAKLKALRIQFGDGQFHGSVEMNQEMMFVSHVRDITDQIAHVHMDDKTGKFSADYIFNHYDFMNATPELREYKDLSKWEISVSTSVESTLDTGKKD